MTAFHGPENLRLEVETDQPGLPNMAKNPSGTKGAWGYVTSVSNTNLTSDGTALRFVTNVTQAAYFSTELVPVAAGQYVGARFDTVASSVSNTYNVKGRFVFYDINKALLSSGPQSAAFDGTPQTNYVASALAPASTAYVALRFDFHNAGGGNPSANGFYSFNRVMVTHAATSADIATSRTNLATNPSFETNTTSWVASPFASIARVTTTAQTGTACLRVTQAANPPVGYVGASTTIPITGGGTYTASAWVKAATTSRTAYVWVNWKNAAGAWVGAGTGKSYGTSASSGWARLTVTGTAPSSATQAVVEVMYQTPAYNEQHYIDAVLLEETGVFRPYFDGSTAAGGGKTYAWTGTAHASTSTEVSAASYDFVEPVAWRNILGPTHEISVDREALNVGTLSATVLDPLLDPAASGDLATGKAVRVQALVGAAWESLFEGRVGNADVSYDRDGRATIRLTATDAISVLANQPEARGVATVADLPYVLEGKGVAWSVNGSGNQVASAAVVSTNENASVVDQVAVTRDSVSGYAWVDRWDVLQAWDAALMPGTATADIAVNGGLEVDTAGWQTGGGNTAIARTTSQFRSGVASLSVTAIAAGSTSVFSPDSPTYAGGAYAVSVWVRAAATARTASLSIRFNDAAGAYLAGGGIVASSPDTTSGWTRLTGTKVAPPGAVTAEAYVDFTGTAAGEVHYVDDVTITGGPALVYSDVPSAGADRDSYSDISAGINTGDVINQVMVSWLRPNPATGETEEIPYGPYQDGPSIATYGAKQATFTLHGATESSANIQAFANAVLAANKTPVRKASEITVPVTDARGLGHAAQTDLYAPVGVEYKDLVRAQYRVTSIRHQITTEGWLVTYGFSTEGAVAAPTATPSPVGTTPVEGVWVAPALGNAWVNAGGSDATCRYMRKNGVVYLQGTIKTGTLNTTAFTLPAGYRPSANLALPAIANGAFARLLVSSAGAVIPVSGSNVWYSISGVSFPAEQ